MYIVGLGWHLGDRHDRVRGGKVLRHPSLRGRELHPLGVQPQGRYGQ